MTDREEVEIAHLRKELIAFHRMIINLEDYKQRLLKMLGEMNDFLEHKEQIFNNRGVLNGKH